MGWQASACDPNTRAAAAVSRPEPAAMIRGRRTGPIIAAVLDWLGTARLTK